MQHGEATSSTNFNAVSEPEKMVHEDHQQSRSNVSPRVDSGDDIHSALASGKALDDHPESTFSNLFHYPSLDAQISIVSGQSASDSNETPSWLGLSASPNGSVSKNNLSSNSSAKVFKLNPRAKAFSPLSFNARYSPATVPIIASPGYISNIPSIMPVAAAKSGVEINTFTSHSSPPKLAHCNGLVRGYNGVPAQYSQPGIGQPNAWQHPVRVSGQFHPVQAGPAYVHPTTRKVVVGRTGQLEYVHPIAQDAIQGASVFQQGSPYPLPSPCQTTMPKIQGIMSSSLQLCVAPPLITGAAQPFAVPGHIPFSMVLPSIRPVLVPGGNGFFGNKLQ